MGFRDSSNLPLGWKMQLLDKLAKRGSGHTPDKSKPHYYDGGIKWVSLADSSALDFGYIFNTKKQISEDGIKNSSAVLHPLGTVILSRDAGVGKSAVLAEPMAVSQHFIAWQCDNTKNLNNWFLYYWLQMMKPEFERQAVGSTIKTIGLPYFKKLKIGTPEIFEQQKIAQILSTWDKAIEKLEALIAAKQKRKKALMQQLLTGKVRFPGFIGKWKEVHLGDIFQRVMRKNIEKHTNVVTISAQKGLIKQEEFFNKNVSSEILDHYFLMHKGEFAYNKSYSNGYPMGAIKRLNNYDKAVVTSLYICFAIKDENKSCGNFFEQYFESGRLINGLMKVANEGGRAHGLLNVTPKDYFALKLTIPDFLEQQKISTFLSAADKEITAHQNQLASLKQQKTSLMQQLLTGKKRVKVGEAG